MKEYQDVCRYEQIADNVMVTATGEYSDFQESTKKLRDMTHQSQMFDDNVSFSVKDYSNYLGKICYEKRNNQNPYYNNFVIAGYENGEAHLAMVDLYGTYLTRDYVTAGFSKHFGLSLPRQPRASRR